MSNYTIDGAWDERGFMKPGAENGLLFSLEAYILAAKYNPHGYYPLTPKKHLKTAIEYVTRNGDISYFDGKGTWSHDNHTALTSASKLLGLNLHKRLTWHGWYRRIHPRDIGYYLSLKYPFLAPVALIPTKIAMIISCAQRYKVRNGVRMVKTDGKLLAWVRFNTLSMPLTKRLCTYFVKRNPDLGSWKAVFETYFGKDHPNSKYLESIY